MNNPDHNDYRKNRSERFGEAESDRYGREDRGYFGKEDRSSSMRNEDRSQSDFDSNRFGNQDYSQSRQPDYSRSSSSQYGRNESFGSNDYEGRHAGNRDRFSMDQQDQRNFGRQDRYGQNTLSEWNSDRSGTSYQGNSFAGSGLGGSYSSTGSSQGLASSPFNQRGMQGGYGMSERHNLDGQHSGIGGGSSSPMITSYGSSFGQSQGGSSRQSGQGQFAGKGPRGYQRSDERVKEDICERLMAHPDIDASDIEVEVKSGEVTLKGTVDQRPVKRMTEECVESISGVKEVHNQLRVKDRNQTDMSRSGLSQSSHSSDSSDRDKSSTGTTANKITSGTSSHLVS
jgi:osmotically-inducible protein OsmY